MLFNRQGLQQKNWRMVKKGKDILFGCSLFFVVGAVNISGPQVTYAGNVNGLETVSKQEKNSSVDEEDSNATIPTLEKEKQTQSSSNKRTEKITANEIVGASTAKIEVAKKEVNKKELEDLVVKIKKTDISKKTEKSAEKLNLILSRAEKTLEDLEITQEEIDKEVKELKEAFDNLEDKPKEDKKSEAKEKVESKKEEKSNVEKNTKEKDQENTTEDVARKHNEKIIKVTETVTEIHSIANQINYEFSDAEKELVKTAENLSTARNSDKNNEETIQKLLNEVIYLRNRVANRMTRENSGKRDSRNGKVIKNSGESTFRGIEYKHEENRRDGNLIENGSTAVYYNSDEIWSKIKIKGKRVGNEKKFTAYVRGKVVEDETPYYIVTVGFTENSPIKGLKMHVAYWDKKAEVEKSHEIEYGKTEINNPITDAAIRGVVGQGGVVQPGRYEVHIASNTRIAPNQLKPYTFTFIIKPQSERNTVNNLTPTYVDDVRHLTENEKIALIEKFKTEHPDVMTPSGHKIDFDHAEISSDGSTMTIHFKDGLSTKTIQTNAQNDVDAKYPSLTTLVGDPHDFYKNPRNLVKSKTNHEVPQTARVTWKTPFDFSQPGTKNAVVTVSYDNGVTKDVTTPYTVLDFIGKQDKSINQNQSGELGDARSYIKLSNGTDPATDLTIRWKGGSSVDTSAQGTQRKEIEILRGNTVMKTVTIPVAIVDDIKPTITAPDSVLLTRAEGLPGNISIDAHDNARGIGLKDTNPIVVENLVNPLSYNSSTKRIELSGVIPNNFQRTQATIKAVDKNGNTATKTITFNVQAQTDKYNAIANPQKQTVSYDARPDAGLSVNKNGLPAGTTYAWATTPSTTTGPGEKAGVVTVTYPDTSKDTVNVTIAVRKLSDEHEPTGTKIVRNQNTPVTNNDLKAAVNVNNNGNSKVKSVTPVSSISTANAGMQTIRATVTYLDNTTDFVDIPLEVKDVTAPTIQTPTNGQNWDLIALDRTLPSIKVAATDNPGGSGIKSTTVTGLPDFLVYDEATKTIKFKNGVQEVTKLPVGQDSKTYNATIQVTDNANNPSQRQITITVKSMTTKYNATPSGQKQTVSYGVTPDAGTSINKNGLPDGTRYTWATTPSTTTGPGDKAGVVTVTYPDDSIDTVNVTVNVRRLADEYAPTGTKIIREQNTAVTNDNLKAAVTISNNGNNKVKSVTPVGTISTAEFGNKTINATVTYLDDTTDSVTIPLEVRDVTKPTIQTPTDRRNWDLIALDRTLPEIKVAATDNPGGSGIKSTTVTGLPNFLTYDEATKTIKFKNGVQEVTKLPAGTDVQTHNITITVTDNANNSNSAQVTITVKSMTTKYDATANSEKQTVSYGATPDAATSVNKTNLPAGTTYIWATTPSTTTGPGDKAGVVTVTYPDGSKDTVNVTVNVKGQADTYTPEPKEQTVDNGEVPEAKNSIGNVDSLPPKTTFEWKDGAPNTAVGQPGEVSGTVIVRYPDGTSEEVPVKVNVRQSNEKGIPEVQLALPEFAGGVNGEPEEQPTYPEFAGGVNTPDSPSRDISEYTDSVGTSSTDGEGTVITPPITEVPEYTDPVGTSSTDGEGNLITPPTAEVPEYTEPVGTSSTDGEGNLITPPTAEVPEYTEPVGTSSTDGEGNVITPPTAEVPEYTEPVGTSSTDGEGNLITPPTAEIPEYTEPVGTSSTDGEGNEITPPTAEIPKYTEPVGTSSTDGEGNEITPPTVEIPEYTDPVGISSTDGEGNEITPPTVEIPEYTEPVGTSSTDGEGNLITPPTAEIPEYTEPVGTSSTDGEGNEITPPTAEIPEYTDPVGTSSTDGEGNLITPPTAEIPEYTDPVGTSSTDGEGNLITPPTAEIPEYTDPIGTSSTDGEGNEITPPTAEIPEFKGGTVAIDSPINKEDKYSEVQFPKVIKRLANTGETDTNAGLTGVGLAIAGSLLIVGKRRKKDEE